MANTDPELMRASIIAKENQLQVMAGGNLTYPPARSDEVRIMAVLARIEAKLDRLLSTKEDGQ